MSGSFVLRGGTLYDGTGAPAVRADIRVKGDAITAVGAGAVGADEIDIDGLAVCPGFIDAHAHSDFILLSEPSAEGKLLQGITTEINGNCGMSAAPLIGASLSQREADLQSYGIRERWEGFGRYFQLLETRGIGPNFATLAGHGNIRGGVVGYEDRAPSDDELSRMISLLETALEDGAIGLSTGLIYPPGVYSTTEELIALSRAGGRAYGGFIYTTHMRSEGDMLIESIEETLRIGREAGVRVHVSHIKTSGRENWHKAGQAIALLDEARAEGVRVTCDRYPYTAGSTDLDAVLPSWTYVGGNSEELKRLRDPEIRERILREIDKPDRDWASVVVASIESEASRWMEGMSIAGISARMGVAPAQAIVRILDDESLRVGAIFHSMSEDNLIRFLSLPYAMIGTDSTARPMNGLGKPHPRGFGSMPRYLNRYSGGSLDTAIHKITELPARTFGLDGRGLVAPGYRADLVVFDPEEIADTATFESPYQAPHGIRHVFVNGVALVRDGKLTGALPGRILRHGK